MQGWIRIQLKATDNFLSQSQCQLIERNLFGRYFVVDSFNCPAYGGFNQIVDKQKRSRPQGQQPSLLRSTCSQAGHSFDGQHNRKIVPNLASSILEI
jgi:hypothetical protein